MILVDSSALIEFYRPTGDPRVQSAVAAAIAGDLAAVNGIIQVEVVGFAASEKERTLLSEDSSALHWLDLTTEVFATASSLGFDLLRGGLTVPATDLIIAASALVSGAELLHLDNYFDQIATVSDLVAWTRERDRNSEALEAVRDYLGKSDLDPMQIWEPGVWWIPELDDR